jgi:anti-sigma factor RsiW
MGAGPLFQVASSDRHTVKPWFQGKLDYAPEVPDLHDAGFELLGGRIDKVRGHDTAALAYQLRKHIISVYVMPTGTEVSAKRLQQRGFNIVRWSDGVMQIWAVTDADASELERFETAWRSKFAVVPEREK